MLKYLIKYERLCNFLHAHVHVDFLNSLKLFMQKFCEFHDYTDLLWHICSNWSSRISNHIAVCTTKYTTIVLGNNLCEKSVCGCPRKEDPWNKTFSGKHDFSLYICTSRSCSQFSISSYQSYDFSFLEWTKRDTVPLNVLKMNKVKLSLTFFVSVIFICS